jgi:hypothetical protein
MGLISVFPQSSSYSALIILQAEFSGTVWCRVCIFHIPKPRKQNKYGNIVSPESSFSSGLFYHGKFSPSTHSGQMNHGLTMRDHSASDAAGLLHKRNLFRFMKGLSSTPDSKK